ncbi:MAG: chromosome segregation protein SMC [Acidobacteriota bacterium]|nr:chromosome segregation protein SMC [Acidobacteriota bacterium]
MFKLQRLEITGFKSFADYTEIVFTGNGITAVVGPNGCGKSNVSDCISWVLGEQRAKSLRGGEMKDVVFQGSRNRKPSGMAEVVLHLVRDDDEFDIQEEELEDIDEALGAFDENAVDLEDIEPADPEFRTSRSAFRIDEKGFNTEEFAVETLQAAQVGSIQTVERTIKTKRHWRPRSVALEFAPGEAVSVTRRLYLSGESEYQLNGKNCRLRDIQDLFAGTGLSGAHYAIVEQGRIGQILSAKPSDRRNLIEEAAGISKFRTRQRAAEARLDSAKTNLGRISDIVSEIDKQANSLRRQAGKTRRFIALQEEFRNLSRELFAAEGRYYSNLIDDLSVRLEDAVAIEQDFAAMVADKEELFRKATETSRSAEENLTDVRRRHSENALERDRADREHRYQSEQIVNFNNRSEALRKDLESVTQRIKLARSEINRLKKEEEKESADARAAEASLREAENQYAGKMDELKQIEAELDVHRSALLQHTTAAERFTEIQLQLGHNLKRLDERADGLAREGVRAGEAFAEHNLEARLVTADLKAEHEKLSGLYAEKKVILSVTGEARKAVLQSDEALKLLQQEFSAKKHRLETLRELEEKRAVYTPQVQKLFAEQKKIGVRLNGLLADFLNVDERAERAVESLLGLYLQTVLVETLSDAKKVDYWVGSNDAGRVASLIIPSSKLGTANPRVSKDNSRIEQMLGASDELLDVLRLVFPRELSAELVENFTAADKNNGRVIVNIEGDLSVGGKLFVRGKSAGEGKNSSLLAFKRELAGLEKTTQKLGNNIEISERKFNADRKILADLEEKTVDLQSLIIKVERHLLGLEVQEKSILQEIDRAERHRQVIAAETKQIETENADLRHKIAEAKSNGENAENLRSATSVDLERISQILSRTRFESDAGNIVLNQKRTMAATSDERKRSVQSALRRVKNEENELDSRIAQLNLEISEINGKITQLRVSVSDIAGKIASADDDQIKEQDQLNRSVEAVKITRETADSASFDLAALNRKSADAMNERSAIEIRQTEAVTQIKNLNEKCTRELNIPLADLVENKVNPAGFDLENARIEVEKQRQTLDGFGAINMLALEELSETEERLNFLTSQRQDIVDSINSAEEALREIKERSRAKFKQAFEAVNANFSEFFQELFGGGRGEMSLLESDDILEAGIEIAAQPPGKRLQNILLLSGGEKAMTAIALVLAIFKYRPSPFCLLDEVDAPLDDANVGRFVNKIAEMSEKTQFIVITHNKRTMEAARALYGVTMQEAGVSKIVSVKFD